MPALRSAARKPRVQLRTAAAAEVTRDMRSPCSSFVDLVAYASEFGASYKPDRRTVATAPGRVRTPCPGGRSPGVWKAFGG